MKTLYGIKELPKRSAWPVITIGGFDGVHRGHQAVISETVKWAKDKNGESLVLTFATHPRNVLSGSAPSFITSLEHRLLLFQRLGVSLTVVLEFDEVSGMSAEHFIKDVISKSLGTKGWVLGFDFAFGKGRRGDFNLVSSLSKKYGFEVRSCPVIKHGGEIISSSRIRKAILQGDLEGAEGMLGRPLALMGTVVKGSGRGTKLGFPTANLDLHHEVKPPSGVYASIVTLDERDFLSLTSIGTRPTFESEGAEEVVEVYIIDFTQSLYGKDLEVKFLFKLRDEIRFESADALRTQMEKDKEEALHRQGKKTLTRQDTPSIMSP
ncbi:MAG TPA: bifunctional riboflavin kinase/FAD synthetase [Candidatus Avalokitesvara rifleensis]|uniref:bifunctional riboflavin kinase/FAD synthetase n=1 Tax=Candidatus Avalokitesvara rifleensis TaxID=3367620 RepID=UPI00271354F1|nr:bifunctional riboflavin kinase/FAD synthetase [Candidatus Brocadiales bacterium]